MTNPIAVSQRARECLATAYEQSGHRDEAAAFRAGDWTCHDHPALVAMVRFEAEIRADEQSKAGEQIARLQEEIRILKIEAGGPPVDDGAKAVSIFDIPMTPIRNQKDHDHE